VRYVALVTRAAPDSGARGRPDPALADSLAAQLDLAVSRIEPGAVVYENQAWLPGRAVVPRGTDVPVDSPDPLAAAQRTALPTAKAVKGPQSGSDPAGPGTLLWAESANSGWHATVNGTRAPRSDAFGWTNGFDVRNRGKVDLSFAGGPRRLFVAVELLLWIAAALLWWRGRAGALPPRRDGV
jgi:hypothetical protein